MTAYEETKQAILRLIAEETALQNKLKKIQETKAKIVLILCGSEDYKK